MSNCLLCGATMLVQTRGFLASDNVPVAQQLAEYPHYYTETYYCPNAPHRLIDLGESSGRARNALVKWANRRLGGITDALRHYIAHTTGLTSSD